MAAFGLSLMNPNEPPKITAEQITAAKNKRNDLKRELSAIQKQKEASITSTRTENNVFTVGNQPTIDALNIQRDTILGKIEGLNEQIDEYYYNKYFSNGHLKYEYERDSGSIIEKEIVYAMCHAIKNKIELQAINYQDDTWKKRLNAAKNETARRESLGMFTFMPESVQLKPGATSAVWTKEFEQNGGNKKPRGSKRKMNKKRKTRKYSKK